MELLFGVLVLLGVVMSVSGFRPQPIPLVLLSAGTLSGVMGTVASVGGPPMALVYQDALGARIRSTMSGFFVVGTTLSLVALRLVGRLGADEVRLALLMLPSLLAGFMISRWTAGIVDRGYARVVVLAIASLSGVLVIIR